MRELELPFLRTDSIAYRNSALPTAAHPHCIEGPLITSWHHLRTVALLRRTHGESLLYKAQVFITMDSSRGQNHLPQASSSSTPQASSSNPVPSLLASDSGTFVDDVDERFLPDEFNDNDSALGDDSYVEKF